MIKSFNSWSNINEAITAKNKQILINPVTGDRQKIVWKLQDDSNLIVKIVRGALDLLDSKGNLTQNGVTAFTDYFNNEPNLTTRIGSLDTQFFTRKFMVYTVLHEGQNRTKIQFKIVDRSSYPEIPTNVTFINSNGLQAYVDKNPELNTVIADANTKVKDQITGEPEVQAQKAESEATGTQETVQEVGNKFLYTMRTNGKNYLMEFTEDGSLDATCEGDGPDGAISYESGQIFWYTDEDSIKKGGKFLKWTAGTALPLYSDIEITNSVDKTFLVRMFTDDSFREQTIREYEEKYGSSEINEDTLRDMLYYKNGTPIFGGKSISAEGEAGEAAPKEDETSVLNLLKNSSENRMFLDTSKYSKYLTEQSAVLSQDLDPRLKDYLSDNEFISYLSDIFSDLADGTESEIQLQKSDKESYGILPEDNLMVKVDKINPREPRFYLWIMNEKFIYGDIDFDVAANTLNSAGEGTAFYERGFIGSVVSFVSGGGEDAGTDEDTIVALSGALSQIAAEKGIDPELYFNRLSSVYSKKYGKSVTAFLEDEFSGRAEVVSLNVFRREIEPSTWRGVDIWSILGDAVLTIGTLGGSLFVKGIRGASVTNKIIKGGSTVSKFVKGSKVGKLGTKVLSTGQKVLSRVPGWNKLTKAAKFKAVGSTVKTGDKIKYLRGGQLVEHEVIDVTETVVKLKPLNGSPFVVNINKFATDVDPAIATKMFDAAGIPVALGTKKVADVYSSSTSDSDNTEANWAEQGAEAMGWYDTLQADPRGYQTAVKEATADELASMLLDLKNGSGFFGNTTDQEELAICLIITGLTPDGCKELQKAYAKVDDTTVYEVIDDEIGGDHGMFTKAYWTACTGEGQEYAAPIAKVRQRISAESAK